MATSVHMDLISPEGERFEVPFSRARVCVIAYGWNPVSEKIKSVQPEDEPPATKDGQ